MPRVHGDIVVWMDGRNGDYDIYGYNFSDKQEFPICTAPGNQLYPSVYGNTVVWQKGYLENADIYGAYLNSDPVERIRLTVENPGDGKHMYLKWTADKGARYIIKRNGAAYIVSIEADASEMMKSVDVAQGQSDFI